MLDRLGVGTLYIEADEWPLGVYAAAFEFLGGTPALASEIMGMHSIAAACTFAADFAGSVGFTLNDPVSTFTAAIFQNSLSNQIGTMSVSTAGAFSFTTTGGLPVSCAIGDVLIIQAPGITVEGLANLSWTFLGSML